MRFLQIVYVLLLLLKPILSLNNGLALTPPMGWLTWERFRCTIDCKMKPNDCISENLITRNADAMVSKGFLEAGYEYVGIDDCWSEMERDQNQKLVADKSRFPKGMKYVSDYVHKKGLKFGIYADYGTKTCAKYPGSLNYLEIDANTFAEWDVDYVKFDGCNVHLSQMDKGYPKFGELLNKTGRPMLYSCSWPAYQASSGMEPDFEAIAKHCNMWRNWNDIDDSWKSVEAIILYFADNSKYFAKYAGAGHWNDPDMLVIGNFGLSYDQSRVQMVVWAMLAAPLLISADIDRMRPEFIELLQNRDVIAVNQDVLGRAGYRVIEKNGIHAWKREIMPVEDHVASLALAFVNHNKNSQPSVGNFSFKELELKRVMKHQLEIKEIMPYDTKSWSIVYDEDKHDHLITFNINPTGVLLLKFSHY